MKTSASCRRFCHPAFAFFAVTVLLTTAPQAADFTLEQVLSAPFPSGLTAATHAARVAWVFNEKGVRNVWTADGPSFAARRVTHYTGDDGEPIASLRLTPDGRTVVYVRGSEANEQGRIAAPTSRLTARKQLVWAVDVDSGAARTLGEMGCTEEGCEDVQISPDGQFAVWTARKQLWIAPVSDALSAHQLTDLRGNNRNPKWSPDGRQLAFVSDRGDHSFIALLVLGQDSVRYLAPSVDRDLSPRWSPDGRQITFLRIPGKIRNLPLLPRRSVPWSIWVANVASGNAGEIWHSGTEAHDSFPELTADVSFALPPHDRVLFASEMDGWNHLYSISTTGGQPVLLTPGQFEVEDVTQGADLKSVIYSSNQNDPDRRHIWRVRLPDGKPQAITQGETIEWTPVETGQGNFVICLGSTATSPAMPYRVTSEGREILAGSELPKDFPCSQLLFPKQVTFRSGDGLMIHGQLFVPHDHTTASPALIYLHGGPNRQMMLGFHYMDYYHKAYAMNQYLAGSGFVVLSVNYRLGIMYGRGFREAERAWWRGASEYQDILAAVTYLQGLLFVSKNKIGLWGGSYGGYLTALGLARDSEVFAAGVDLHGVHDWSVLLPPGWEEQPQAPDLKEAQKLAFESSPNASIATWNSPVLLIHADDDRDVPFRQTVDLAQRLREHHVPMETIVLPDEVHMFLRHKSWIGAYRATADFFDRVLKRGETISQQ